MPTTNIKSQTVLAGSRFTGTNSDELAVSDPNTELLNSLLAQNKITNLHLSLLTDNTFFKGEAE